MLHFFFHSAAFMKQKPTILVVSAQTTGSPVLSRKRFAGRHQDSIQVCSFKPILNIIQQANEYLDQAEKADTGWNKVGIGGKLIVRELFKWVILACQRS